jgi:hypothetical protein
MPRRESPSSSSAEATGKENLFPTPFILDAAAEAEIRQAAREALSKAFATLAEERVLPRSEHRPWIWMARDYFGYAVEGERGALGPAISFTRKARVESTEDFDENKCLA